MKKELLAPAGDIEAGYAALYYGADAVYLGLQQFSARATATNFAEADLNEFVGFAHSLIRKVYVAINTLVQESELPELLNTLDICRRTRVDAVIIQDLGVARIVRECYPEMEMHASTQMAVHNKEGAAALQKLGFSRVVLARELSLSEIKEIAAIPSLETEAFIHGALCYSYSGLCLFSSMENGRSANRGKCLYPCRAEFKGEEGAKHYFSMKDMALQEDVLRMPVTSLKIEGRKKTALYVAAVTDYYRKILDGKGAAEQSEENIKQIFSRPWCKFHLNGRIKEVIDRDFVGHRGLPVGKVEQVRQHKMIFRTMHHIARYDGLQIDISGVEKPFGFSLQGMKVNGNNVFEAAAGETVEILLPPHAGEVKKGQQIYLASSSAVKRAYPYEKPRPGEFVQKIPLKVKVGVCGDEVRAEAAGFEATISGKFEVAANPQKVAVAVKQSFEKCGGTPWALDSLVYENPQGLFIPVSMLNDLRRLLYEKIEITHAISCLPPTDYRQLPTEAKLIIKSDDAALLKSLDLDKVEEIIYLLSPSSKSEQLRGLPKNKIRLALPALCRKPELFDQVIRSFYGLGYRKWEIGNYWGLETLPRHGIDLSFDSSLYMMNTQAVQMAKEMGASRVTLSVEDSLVNLQKTAAEAPLAVCTIIYQDVPLFTSAGCIRSNPCKECERGEKRWKLRKGAEAYEVLSRDCQTMLFADKAFCMGKAVSEIKSDYVRIDFCYKPYTVEEAAAVVEKLCGGQDISGTIQANLFRNTGF